MEATQAGKQHVLLAMTGRYVLYGSGCGRVEKIAAVAEGTVQRIRNEVSSDDVAVP